MIPWNLEGQGSHCSEQTMYKVGTMGTWLKVMVTRSLGTYCLPWNEEGVPMSHLKDPLGTIPCIPPKSCKHRKTHSPSGFLRLSLLLGWKWKWKWKLGCSSFQTVGNNKRAITNLTFSSNTENHGLSWLKMNTYWLATCLLLVLDVVNVRGSFSGKKGWLGAMFFQSFTFESKLFRWVFAKGTYFSVWVIMFVFFFSITKWTHTHRICGIMRGLLACQRLCWLSEGGCLRPRAWTETGEVEGTRLGGSICPSTFK